MCSTKLKICTIDGCTTSARNRRSAIAIAWASASPECTKPLSTTGRSLTLRSSARYTQPSPPCAMQPLISYWPATTLPGLSCGRNEYGLPQKGDQPPDCAFCALLLALDRPTGRPQF